MSTTAEVNVCDVVDEVCLRDYWIETSPINNVDPDCEFEIVADETDDNVTLTNADISSQNPCIEFDDFGCGITTIRMRCKSPTCEGDCYGPWTTRKFRNCCDMLQPLECTQKN